MGKILRDERKKQIGDDPYLKEAKLILDLKDEKDVLSYMQYLGQVSQDWLVAAKALEKIGAPAVDALIQAIESDNPLLRGRAMNVLSKMGDERAIKALTKASNITKEDFRRVGTKPISVPGMVIEFTLEEGLEDYRKVAKDALEKLKKNLR